MRRVSPARDILLAGTALIVLTTCSGRKQWDNRWQEIVGRDLSAEELIQEAEDFLALDPPLRYASEARFTIGFAWAESLKRYGEARRWFEELLADDPEGGWAEEARWMIENMEKDVDELLPQLRQEVPPPEPGTGTETPPAR